MDLKEKIKLRFDTLEESLRRGEYLTSDDKRREALELVASISKFTSALSEGERDFVIAAKVAINDQHPWT